MEPPPNQKLKQRSSISDSVLKSVQIGDITGQNLKLEQIQDGIGLINIYGTVQVDYAPLSTTKSLIREEQEWRKILLSKVQQFWIDGVLGNSLHNQVLQELGLEDWSDSILNPLRDLEELPAEIQQVLARSKTATNLFEDIGAGRTMLILGEPGSGKTVTLLKLAASLIARSKADLSQPLPVVMNLSSWARQQQSIEEWLVQELYETYTVAKVLGKAWIEKEQLILLLDGLDEVESKHQNACVDALNHFMQTHNRTEMVVCSRVYDYESLSKKLSLQNAIYVQPLQPQQIDDYLEQVGAPLAALRAVISEDSEIQTLASSPLLLSIMSLTYQGCTLDDFPQSATSDIFRQHLFDTYIKRIFKRRETAQPYLQEQATHWLIWVAQQMLQNSQTIFRVEGLQPNCFHNEPLRMRYRLESGLLIGLISGLLVGLFSGPLLGLTIGLIVGLIVGCLERIKMPETVRWSRKEAIDTLPTGLETGLAAGVMIGLILGLMYGAIFGLMIGAIYGAIFGLAAGLIIGLMVGLMGGFRGPGIDLPNKSRVHLRFRKSLRTVVAFGLIVGSISGLMVWLMVGSISGLIYGLIFGLIVGLLGELTTVFRGQEVTLNQGLRANQELWKSFRNAITFGLMGGLSSGLLFGLIFGPYSGMRYGLIGGLIGGLLGGGTTCLRHFSLRVMLYRMRYIPWDYARFLDDSVNCLFLQKIGDGYIFIHRMLLEHFASMDGKTPYELSLKP
ncbi:NACHT domain-containing protein [Acaryochloris marina]|uniref:NACHT domain-containing protein n=1 Tax=Acaryochloris marina TaxID=155978 RepID=UPI001BAFAB58|nr:NACHT domain-containing protein [Acaryochloris marina]QUY44780.1 NACHT domain-containing protein [Acaryochloris marina S15]